MLLNCGVGETLESALDCKKIKPVNPKGNQSWIFIGRTDAEPETPILWPPDSKNRFIGKDPDAEKDWRQEEKSTTEDEMVGWHQQLDGHEFEQALGIGDGQGSLVCCSPWDCKESDMTEWLNWTKGHMTSHRSEVRAGDYHLLPFAGVYVQAELAFSSLLILYKFYCRLIIPFVKRIFKWDYDCLGIKE